MIVELNGENFRREVLLNPGLTLVDFWASRCVPCRMMAPILVEVAKVFAGRVKVGRVDIEADARLANEFKVMSLPTLVVFRDGVMVDRLIGAQSLEALCRRLRKWQPPG